MENKIEKAVDKFIDVPESDEVNKEKLSDTIKSKNVILNEREGLIERIDRQFVTSDGRILLREQY